MPVLQEQWLRAPRVVIKDLFGECVFPLLGSVPSILPACLPYPAERAAKEGGGGLQEDGCWGITKFFESKLKGEEELAGVRKMAVPQECVCTCCLS